MRAIPRQLKRSLGVAVSVTLMIIAFAPVSADAVIHPAAVLDGPANNILEVDGAAMAPDGTGGIVYRKEGPEGVAHVWVVPFLNGRWGAPIQVDTGNPYPATLRRVT
jgi:hypothetical protein